MPELHSTPARPTLDSVQALRGLAAVMVVFFHAQTAELAGGIGFFLGQISAESEADEFDAIADRRKRGTSQH